MRTDEQQCLPMKTVLTVGLTQMTSEHYNTSNSPDIN